jgi:hypothetical protein
MSVGMVENCSELRESEFTEEFDEKDPASDRLLL